jgi:hypothetical protein
MHFGNAAAAAGTYSPTTLLLAELLLAFAGAPHEGLDAQQLSKNRHELA